MLCECASPGNMQDEAGGCQSMDGAAEHRGQWYVGKPVVSLHVQVIRTRMLEPLGSRTNCPSFEPRAPTARLHRWNSYRCVWRLGDTLANCFNSGLETTSMHTRPCRTRPWLGLVTHPGDHDQVSWYAWLYKQDPGCDQA